MKSRLFANKELPMRKRKKTVFKMKTAKPITQQHKTHPVMPKEAEKYDSKLGSKQIS